MFDGVRRFQLSAFFILFSVCAFGQGPIEDNSFLIEEAYNQQNGVIQYINTFYRERNGNWGYSFINEMPIQRQAHQFSYAINVSRVAGTVRLGDTLVNYRYQAKGLKEADRVAMALRFSAILPTGSYRNETGWGALGFQFNFATSIKHSKYFVTHWNAGWTYLPRARNRLGERSNVRGLNLGQSTVFLVKRNFNIFAETVWNRLDRIDGPGRSVPDYSLLLNPGIRWAWNFKNGLQIVPGISMPIGLGPSNRNFGNIFYLSFEK